MDAFSDPLCRGMTGPLPALPSRSAEAYLNFLSDARLQLMHTRWAKLSPLGKAVLGGEPTRDAAEIRARFATVPELAAYFRIKRSVQEAAWQKILEAYQPHRAALEQLLAESDTRGPGSVRWDDGLEYPAYATCDIHLQPGGYARDSIAGFVYDHGTQVFFGSIAVGDAIHQRVADLTAVPVDGNVTRVLEVGCSIGQMTCALKRRFASAEVHGIDISAPMVRYAHWRAAQAGIDVQFAQMSADALTYPAGHFDLVVAHILFHELPVDIIDGVIREAFRALRPGGTFVVWDFPSSVPGDPGFDTFVGDLDVADNGEPFAVAFVRCGIEDRLTGAGFALRHEDRRKIAELGRIADKPARH